MHGASSQTSCTHLRHRTMWGFAVCWCLCTLSCTPLTSNSLQQVNRPKLSRSKKENGKIPRFYSKCQMAEEVQSLTDGLITTLHCHRMPIATECVHTELWLKLYSEKERNMQTTSALYTCPVWGKVEATDQHTHMVVKVLSFANHWQKVVSEISIVISYRLCLDLETSALTAW